MLKPFYLIPVFCLLQLSSYSQYDPGATMMLAQNNMLYNNTIQSFVNQNIINDLAYSNTPKAGGTRRSKATAPADAATFLISPGSSTSVKVKQSIINRLKSRNPTAGKNLENALNQYDPFNAYLRLLTSLGLDVHHNYADAFTAYILGMWRIANGMSGNPTLTQINAVRSQVRSNVRVAGWSNQQKQEAVEYMIYDLIFANEPYESSRKARDKKQMALDADMVYQRFLKQHKMDLRNMRLTDKGLI
ncbi:hypothetical protein HF324_18590 [Chitinophaga oryzae]|uniref:DUF4919 domain-containing protein n=1 Tax=Chitinophaga oryzae TaxID=2725414 RepID=A0AAE6ZJT3_9BACT|nr:hypothetical protein [Chitinophaga oryzae]QJB33237.1 hypothetical protein HF329_18725 [Chitinophaga oryzae]QJB39757.1 hypothetical protein HF324_18590 [Chitinophaga oryzae]